MKYILIAQFVLLSMSSFSAEKPKQGNPYLEFVQTFADQLIQVGTDHYGYRNTAMWASVINLDDLTVPVRNVPGTKGVRSYDRAVGGSNYYHDVMTMKVFDAISDRTGNQRYADAVKAYTKDFLDLSQNPETGLLGWGEHLYYDFFRDTVTIAESRIFDQRDYFKMPHEFLAWTPAWERLWKTNPEKTARAIEGIMWHFNGPDTKTYLFNRHAIWNQPVHQNVVMPWIKHSVLFAYSFAFLYHKTGNELWRKRAREIALLYWNLRDYDTNLVFNCFYHESDPGNGKNPGISSTGQYAYWMYKTGEELEDETLKETAKAVMFAYDQYGWNVENKGYYKSLQLDGTPLTKPEMANVWEIGYGSPTLFSYAKTAVYISKKENDKEFLEIAQRCEKQIPISDLPQQYTAQNLGEAINFYIDLYELTKNDYYLAEAKEYAGKGMQNLVKNGLLLRQVNDHYYEAKLGIGDLLAGLFRLGMIESDQNDLLKALDFSY